MHVCLRINRLSSPSITPPTLRIHSFIHSFILPFSRVVCHTNLEINAQSLINLCNYNRIFTSLVYVTSEITLTHAVVCKMVDSVPKIVYDRLVLKLVQIWLIMSGCYKISWKRNCRFCKIWERFTFLYFTKFRVEAFIYLRILRNLVYNIHVWDKNYDIHLQRNQPLNKHIYLTSSKNWIQYTVCCVQYTVCCVQYTVYSMLCTVCSIQYTVCCVQYTVYCILL